MSQEIETKPDIPIHGPVHPLQKLMDNPWLLLGLGLLVPFVSYTAWGWLELLTIEAAKLP